MTDFDAGFIVLLHDTSSRRNRRKDETLSISLYLSVFNLLLFVNIITTKPVEHAYNTYRYSFFIMSTQTQQSTAVNLFDAVPFVTQVQFESNYNTYDDIPYSEIADGVKHIYKLNHREFPQQFWNDYYYKSIKNMLINSIECVLDDPWTYNDTLRVNTIELNKTHNIGYNS